MVQEPKEIITAGDKVIIPALSLTLMICPNSVTKRSVIFMEWVSMLNSKLDAA